jgi:ubiquinone/menaquinone biosynthesis C-methylase UbiE
MLKQLLQWIKYRIMARQLRRPSGSVGIKTGKMMNKANAFLYDTMQQQLKLSHGESILEIGFGNGLFFQSLFQQANDLRIAGLDFSKDMVTEAINYNKKLIDQGKLALQCGNSDKMPFADNSFDKVFCINVVYFWKEPTHHLNEIYRVLKPGGRFYAIIRTKESMAQMPFTKYGFTSYTEESWKDVVQQTKLLHNNIIRFAEPTVEFQGNLFTVESYCLIAEKKN